MAEKKYVGAEALIRLVAQLKTGFASMVHKHKIKDIEDYVVDTALSDTSTNPVENKAIKAEFQAITDILTSKANISDLTNGSFTVKNAEHAGTTDFATDAQNATNATHAVSANSATKATQDANGAVIVDTYETKTDALAKLNAAKQYADTQIAALVDSAPETLDTLGELAAAINENEDVVEAINNAITNKADKEHTHTISEIVGTPATATVGQTAIVKTIDENGMPIEWEAADLGNITIDEDGNAWFGTAEEIYKIPEGLPDYTDEDEGKVLSVVDGMAAWTENKGGSGSSGGGGIVVSETEPTDESVIFWVQI